MLHAAVGYCQEEVNFNDYYRFPFSVGVAYQNLSPFGDYYIEGIAHRAAIHEDMLFVAEGGEGMKILDISIPTDPVELGSLATEDARDIAVLPGYALIADSESGTNC